jgi:hypothetical protein
VEEDNDNAGFSSIASELYEGATSERSIRAIRVAKHTQQIVSSALTDAMIEGIDRRPG